VKRVHRDLYKLQHAKVLNSHSNMIRVFVCLNKEQKYRC